MAEPLRPPVSKSDAHRALVLAEVCDGAHEALLPPAADRPRDVEVLSAGLRTLRSTRGELDCLDAGAPFRFLLTQAALVPNGAFVFRGTPRLGERPLAPLVEALRRALEVSISRGDGGWPLEVRAGPRRVTGAFRVEGAASSQFASSLLLGAARLVKEVGAPVTVELVGETASAGYLALTIDWLRRFGFEVHASPAQLTVTRWARVAPPASLPGDWSSLTMLLLLAWRGHVGVSEVDRTALHPDARFAAHLESAGLSLPVRDGLTFVEGALARGLDVDASVCPDAMPALVALSLVAPGPSTFTSCGVLRLKESDRLDGLSELVRLLGGEANVVGETLTVTPPARARAGRYDGRGDHRLVMAAAVAGALLGVEVAIVGTKDVEKSFPGFWREAAKVGVRRVEAP